ncbi:YfbK domain-containing protein [Flagellimonas sp. 2504JD4-2]
MKKSIITFILCLLAFASSAQLSKISGNVSDASGPLPGASVLVQGTARGIQTDFDGNFEISAQKGDTLIISYIGYKNKFVTIEDVAVAIKIVLEEDASSFNEVVVVGYGARRVKKSLAYSVSSVSSNQPQNTQKMDIARLLQGKVAGVHITTTNGLLTKQQRLLVKEAQKKKPVADMIYIVDGKPIAQANNSIIENLHPNTILKKHIYKPTRAKNTFGITGPKGCIVIETKSGNYKVEDDESYARINENKFEQVLFNPLSTFSIDMDKASYSNIRRMINNGQEVKSGAVKIEELVNYFDYAYEQPRGEHPFSIHAEVATTPWNTTTKLVRIGLQGKEYARNQLPPSNLTFLIDVSGSMRDQNKLPLLKKTFKLLVNQLRAQDKVAIVVYAGAAGLVLEPTSGTNKKKILEALNNLEAGGSTAGGEGIELAYQIALKNFVRKGNNRVILATDGDFNVGASSDFDMEQLIERKRKSGVFLSVLGFGMGNYKDSKLEILANKGNGNHAYIDTMQEAQKVFGKEFGGTLHTIAKDVKIQVEFNPAFVGSYRLIGYENRILETEDFIDDTKDAGELGSGHKVTALYEIIPVNIENEFTKDHIPLKYSDLKIRDEFSDELLTVKLRYKKPNENKSNQIVHVVSNREKILSGDFSFASAVALFGMQVRKSRYSNETDIDDVIELAENGKGIDINGYRSEFIRLVRAYESSQ